MYILTLASNGEVREFKSGKEAVLWADRMGALNAPDSKRFNPVMVLNSAVKEGTLSYTKDGVEPSMNNRDKKAKAQTPKTENKMKSTEVTGKAAAMAALVKMLSEDDKPSINMDEVREIITSEIAKQRPTKILVKVADKVEVELEHQHKDFTDLLALLANKQNVWLTGPAGSGKTTAASKAAEAMKVDFYAQSVCAQTTKHEFFGYNDANGKYVESSFYKAFCNGGVFLVDEIDAGNPNVLAVLNAALDNSKVAFPCGMVEKHEDFVVVAAANTIGTGGNMEYVGRNRIDAATLNRFWMIDWQYDEKFELALSPDESFTRRVQKIRAVAAAKGISVIVSPRVSIRGGLMLAAGWSEDKVLQTMLWNKMSKDESRILQDASK